MLSLLKDCPCHNQLIHDLGCTEYDVEEELMMMLIPRQCSYSCDNHCSLAERTNHCAGYQSCSKDENRFICSDKQLNENDQTVAESGMQSDNADWDNADWDDDWDFSDSEPPEYRPRARRETSNDQVYTWTEWTDSIESHSILDFFTQFQRKVLLLFYSYIETFFSKWKF